MNDYRESGGYTGEIAMEREQSNAATAITFLLIGAAVGAAVALLLSPVNGEAVRNAISRGYRRTVNGVTERTKDLRERGSNLLGIDRENEADLHVRRS